MRDLLEPDFLCIGHRGASGRAPENTLRAFALALDDGVDALEFDVHRCEDALVVIHDDDLARTTNGRGRVSRTSLETLRRLDAGDGERVPLLEEVLDLIGDRAGVNIELKGRHSAAPVVELLLARGTDPAGVLLSAFDHDELVAARAAAPQFRRGALFGRIDKDPVTAARAVEATTANLARRTVNPGRVAELRAAGLEVLVYTVNDVDEALRLRDLGVRGVFTDHPDRLIDALGRVGGGRVGGDRTGGGRAGGGRVGGDRAGGDRVGGDRAGGDRVGGDRTAGNGAAGDRDRP